MGHSNDTPENPARSERSVQVQTGQAEGVQAGARIDSTAAVTPNLALIRTDLANERTLLAYGRTALMLVATGVSLVRFLDLTNEMVALGWLLIACGAIVGVTGTYRFTSLRQRLSRVRNSDASNDQQAS